MTKKKVIFLSIIASILLFSLISNVQAFYVRDHLGFIIDNWDNVNGVVTNECRDRLAIVLDGESFADAGVIYYGSSDKKLLGTYIATHTRAGYVSCLEEAGQDLDKKCFCYGIGLHSVDAISHNEGGLTAKYLRNFFGSNYLGHMIVERSMENKNQIQREKNNDYAITSGKLDYYNGIFLNSLFTETGGSNKYLEMSQSISGIDMTNTAKIFRSAYIGEGFYNSVYKNKLSLPLWAYGISIGMILIGLIFLILTLVYGKTGWKWVNALFYLIIMIIGIIIIFSFITGTTWKILTFVTEVPASIGYLQVSDSDVVYYNNLGNEYTAQFLKDGILRIDDWSGLSYRDINGIWVDGSLTNAEKPFKYLTYFVLIPGFLFLTFWLMLKSFGLRLLFWRKR